MAETVVHPIVADGAGIFELRIVEEKSGDVLRLGLGLATDGFLALVNVPELGEGLEPPRLPLFVQVAVGQEL